MISTPFSNDFFALSHAPPALFWNIPINTPLTVTPARNPPNASGPKDKSNNQWRNNGNCTRQHHFFNRCFVEIATHFSYSGFPVPSMIPGISGTGAALLPPSPWPLHLLPELLSDENINGIIPPTNKTGKYICFININSMNTCNTNKCSK